MWQWWFIPNRIRCSIPGSRRAVQNEDCTWSFAQLKISLLVVNHQPQLECSMQYNCGRKTVPDDRQQVAKLQLRKTLCTILFFFFVCFVFNTNVILQFSFRQDSHKVLDKNNQTEDLVQKIPLVTKAISQLQKKKRKRKIQEHTRASWVLLIPTGVLATWALTRSWGRAT